MNTLEKRIERLREDHDIRRDVRDELHFDPSIIDAGVVEISVRDGIVTLGGMADSLAQRWAIQRAARRVRGVRQVVEELTVMCPKPQQRADSDIEDAANVVLQWDARVPTGVVASVADGWLTLRGAVANRTEYAAAFDAVRNLIGLRGITNDVEVAPPTAIAAELENTIAAAVRRRIDHDDVRIEVDRGTVVLSGMVASYAEREEIEQAAAMGPGVVEVVDRLQVVR
jgi:osmotically-inducible protein OsmY